MGRYSVEQILAGLRLQFGDIPEDQSLVSQASTFLGMTISSEFDEEVDLESLVTGFEAFFGFSIPEAEWREFLGYTHDGITWPRDCAPKLTFRTLAEFIAARSEGISLEPVTVFGRRNSAAGVFLGLQRLAKEIAPQSGDFAPSSRIRDHFHGEILWKFWQKLVWISERRVPDHRCRRLHSLTLLCALIFSVSLCIFTFQACVKTWGPVPTTFGPIAAVILFAGSFMFVGSVTNRLLMQIISPVPAEITTFRDLAMLIAVKTSDDVYWWREGMRDRIIRKGLPSKNPYDSPTVP